MGPVLKMLTWTAIVALPGGLLLLPVVLADHMAKKRARRTQAVETQAVETEPVEG
jgi:hypothetical protein